jgi:hypothetical protein
MVRLRVEVVRLKMEREILMQPASRMFLSFTDGRDDMMKPAA